MVWSFFFLDLANSELVPGMINLDLPNDSNDHEYQEIMKIIGMKVVSDS